MPWSDDRNMPQSGLAMAAYHQRGNGGNNAISLIVRRITALSRNEQRQ